MNKDRISNTNTYNPEKVENKIYKYWIIHDYFKSYPNNKKPYTIIMPPPNVTGILHMGHVLNMTCQDILIRQKRMKGFNVCWIPGTDHASIATEAKVVNFLKKKGISKFDIGKKKFLEYAWNWVNKYQKLIVQQLKQLGCSCDWNRLKFTLDDNHYQSVIKLFVKLYNEGKIYREYRMINWDCEAQTNISDEEVIYIEKKTKLYFLKYFIEKSNQYVVIATTRPETIFGDTAICFHPNDTRYAFLRGKKLIVPIVNRLVPVIYDHYVDQNFGTGGLKITPAHDTHDYIISKNHNLLIIDIFNKDGTLNKNGLHYEGKDRFFVRNEIIKELKQQNLLNEEQNYINKIKISERTGAVVESKLSLQWFLKMKDIAKPAFDVVMNQELNFFPSKYKNVYKYWMNNICDWNISRQLWWGHQIPVFYFGNGINDFVVAETIDQAVLLVKKKTHNNTITIEDLKQDNDVLDTWFSSWIWPISLFDGLNNVNNKEISYYYPTEDLITGSDIIFFWVARMIMAGYLCCNNKPFHNVYFTGIVRDNLGRKMSKQLGNSPNIIDIIKKYGADSLRMGIIMNSSLGNDVKFDESLCLQGKKFCNKLWNLFRLVSNWKIMNMDPTNYEIIGIIWFENKFYEILNIIENFYLKYRFYDVLLSIYKLIYDDFCSWYLEIIKPKFGSRVSIYTYNKTIKFLENLLKILHPFMPFITEEIWQLLKKRSFHEALIIACYPKVKNFDSIILEEFNFLKNLITAVRNYKTQYNLSLNINLDLYIQSSNVLKYIDIIKKFVHCSNIYFNRKPNKKYFSILVDKIQIFIPIVNEQNSNVFIDKNKIFKQIEYLESFLKSVNMKLSNVNFLNKAKPNIVMIEKNKKIDIEKKIKMLIDQLNKLD